MKRTNIAAMFIITILLALSCNALYVCASEEEIAANLLLNLREDAVLYEEPSEAAAVVGELSENMPVISMEASSNGWVKVMYRDMEGYVLLRCIEIEKNEELVAEFEQMSNENRLVFEIIENKKTQNRQKLMWGIVIATLTTSIFVVGVGSVIAGGRKKGGRR